MPCQSYSNFVLLLELLGKRKAFFLSRTTKVVIFAVVAGGNLPQQGGRLSEDEVCEKESKARGGVKPILF